MGQLRDAQTLNQIPPGQRFKLYVHAHQQRRTRFGRAEVCTARSALACHGGQVTSNGVTGSTLLPLDPGLVKNTVITIDGNYYGGDPSQLRTVNRVVMTISPSAAVAKYLTGIYGVHPRVAISAGDPNYVPPSWTGETSTYNMVVKPYCMMCHLGDTEQSPLFHKSWELLWKQRADLHHRLPDAFHAAYRSSLYNAVEQRYR